MFFHGQNPVDTLGHVLHNGGSALFLAVDGNLRGNEMHWSPLIIATRETRIIKGKHSDYENDVVALRTVGEYNAGEVEGVYWLPSPRGFVAARPVNTWLYDSNLRLAAPRGNKERSFLAMRWCFSQIVKHADSIILQYDKVFFTAYGRPVLIQLDGRLIPKLTSDDTVVDPDSKSLMQEAEQIVVGDTLDNYRKEWLQCVGTKIKTIGSGLPAELRFGLPISRTQ